MWPDICKIKFQETFCKTEPLLRYNAIDCWIKIFPLEYIGKVKHCKLSQKRFGIWMIGCEELCEKFRLSLIGDWSLFRARIYVPEIELHPGVKKFFSNCLVGLNYVILSSESLFIQKSSLKWITSSLVPVYCNLGTVIVTKAHQL